MQMNPNNSWTNDIMDTGEALIRQEIQDLFTKRTLSRHNSIGDLYPFTPPELPLQACFLSTPTLPWHERLGHPGNQVLSLLRRTFNFS
uniref:GAG-pre-integrase domain-containing protein n=2 Tax=Helianthus annuus TaxID=4232 RepID=A0A251RMZ3_HELAN